MRACSAAIRLRISSSGVGGGSDTSRVAMLLLPSAESTAKLWASGRLSSVYLRDVLE